MEPLRIGVFGAATISPLAIVEPAHESGARLVAVAARDRSRAEKFAFEHGVEHVLDTYSDVLNDPEVEAIYNPLPNGLHAPWNLAAIRAGKHVLSEKPFASNAVEAAQVRDAGVAAGVSVVDGFHNLYHPATRRLHELIADGELGEIRRVETFLATPAPPPDDVRWSLPLAGGAMMDLGCYALHAVRHLAAWAGGEPELVSASAGERPGSPGVDEWFDVDLVYPSGATASARCNMAAEERQLTFLVVGTQGEVMLPQMVRPYLDDRVIVRTGSGERVERVGTRSSYTYQLEAFTALVREGVPMPTDSNDAVRTMDLIDSSYRAAGMAPRVEWDGS